SRQQRQRRTCTYKVPIECQFPAAEPFGTRYIAIAPCQFSHLANRRRSNPPMTRQTARYTPHVFRKSPRFRKTIFYYCLIGGSEQLRPMAYSPFLNLRRHGTVREQNEIDARDQQPDENKELQTRHVLPY